MIVLEELQITSQSFGQKRKCREGVVIRFFQKFMHVDAFIWCRYSFSCYTCLRNGSNLFCEMHIFNKESLFLFIISCIIIKVFLLISGCR